jgi:Fe-S-cluster containining protein
MADLGPNNTASSESGSAGAPATWDLETLKRNLLSHVEAQVANNAAKLPLKRILLQLELEPVYRESMGRWPDMDGPGRLEAWKGLLQCVERVQNQMLPLCVQCGNCCRKGSPTLKQDDLLLLMEEKIPWPMLLTLRKGEPAHNPFTEQPFYLPQERVKVREKEGSSECVFLDAETSQCQIYTDRPAQCRAQCCWDPKSAEDLTEMPDMTRRDIFGAVEVLWELVGEHDRRCSFEQLKEAFEQLKEARGETADQVVALLGFDDHYRSFVAERLSIPPDTLDLIFGRSLASRVRLFGFKVDTDPDGTHTLKPDTPASE